MFSLLRPLALATVVLFFVVSLCGAAESTDNLFGSARGYLHPSLDLGAEYTDNYKQTAKNKKSNWQTSISPGFWVALPSTDTKTFVIDTANSSPGGHGVSRFQEPDYKGFQGSLMYDADILFNDNHSSDNMTKHRGQGLLQYSFASGLAIEVSDVYKKDADAFSDNFSGDLAEYDSNLATAIVFYNVSPKLKFRVGYSNFNLDYTSGFNVDFKERTDDRVSTFALYRILPKTELFVQYDYIDIDYDKDILADATDQHVFVGVKFDSNARISGYAKVGYGHYDADLSNNLIFDDEIFEDFIGDASLRYAFWDSSSVTLNAKQAVDVTDTRGYANVLESGVGLSLSHKLTHKIGVRLSVEYKEDQYRVDSSKDGRKDENRITGLSGSYALNDWCTLGMNYTYTDRDSDEDINDYDENLLMFSASARL
jgi:hypothetical protein